MSHPAPAASLRILPETWLDPVDFKRFFPHPERPLEIDLGCGKGRFLLARAARFREINFLGVDRMLRRIRKVDNKALRAETFNIRLLRMEAYYAMCYLFPNEAVRTFYLFFPDPWPKKKHHKYRLMNPAFIDALHRKLEPGGAFHFVTDHPHYFEEVVALMDADQRFEGIPTLELPESEHTDFERYYRDKSIIGRKSYRKRAGD